MKLTVEDLSSVKKVLHIEVPEEDVTRELDDAYKSLKKTAKIKGFRPGKVPRSVLERMFKKDVHGDVSSRLIQSSFVDALKESELNMVGNPNIDPPELEANGPYQYDATIEIRPDIGEIDFKGLELKKTLYTVSDAEVDIQLKMLQKNLTQLEKIEEDRPVQDGDMVLIDYEGFKDGAPFDETGKTENFSMKIGEGKIAGEMDEQLIGTAPGEQKTISVTFPDDHGNSNLAGQTVSFEVSLKEIRKEVVPEINDEMAGKVGAYETLEDLKTAIFDNLREGYVKRTEQELNEQVFENLISKTEFELPETLVNYELEGIISEAERSFMMRNMKLEDAGLSREVLSERYRETAERQVRRHLILGRIVDQENLSVSDDELAAGYKDIADTYGQPVEQIRAFYEKEPDKLELFKHTLLEKQAMKLIIENSNVEEVEPEAVQEDDGGTL